jgi:hypothetical protein
VFQLIAVVLAIGMTALIVAGGVSYFNGDTGTRIQTQQQLQGHFDGLATAISTYRSANNNFLSPNIGSLTGLLPNAAIPRLSTAPDAFSWSIATVPAGGSDRVLCFSTVTLSGVSKGVVLGIAAFIDNAARTRIGLVAEAGASCTTTSSLDYPVTDEGLLSHAQGENLAIAFKGL